MLKKFIVKVIIADSPNDGDYTVYLFNKDEKILIPITTNRWAAESVLLAMQKKTQARPHVHDSFRRAIIVLGGEIVGAIIYEVNDEVFYAYIRILKEDMIFDIDVKVTDALGLALRLDKPIFATKRVCNKAGIKITKDLIDESLKT